NIPRPTRYPVETAQSKKQCARAAEPTGNRNNRTFAWFSGLENPSKASKEEKRIKRHFCCLHSRTGKRSNEHPFWKDHQHFYFPIDHLGCPWCRGIPRHTRRIGWYFSCHACHACHHRV